MKKSLAQLGMAASLCMGASAWGANPVLWVGDAAGRLATIDVVTGATTVIGAMGITMYDIAFDPQGHLYGINGASLYAIDPVTAAASFIGTGGGGNINSLVFGSDGKLYGASTSLYVFDAATGARTSVGSLGAGVTSSGDLAFINGQLYLTGVASFDRLYRVDTGTGAATLIGSTGFPSVYGLASPNGQDLYGFSGGQVLSVNVGTGAATLLSTANGAPLSAVYGAAFYTEAAPPVPEPTAWALMLSGLAALGLLARRRRG